MALNPRAAPTRRARTASPTRSTLLLLAGLATGCGAPAPAAEPPPGIDAEILRGRELVISRDCGGCHGRGMNPGAEGWLAGRSLDVEAQFAGAFRVWPRNLTPDDETGLGRYSERQIFNALRFGLRPGATPDVEITSPVPGEGNHPRDPDYLAPMMPWLSWRHLADDDLRAIAAYLKRGLRPVEHRSPEPEAPPDRWAAEFAFQRIGSHKLPPFPTAQEEVSEPERLEEILLGRVVVATTACGMCHGSGVHPGQEGWLRGIDDPSQEWAIGPYTTRPRNLTPDNLTGLGRFSERQLYNALRFGLRPGETADVEITSPVPGEGGHPLHPKYMAPPMPWLAWRHLPDEELRAAVAYLKFGLKPVHHRVADSEGPPDFWAAAYLADALGSFAIPDFPTEHERRPE